MLDLVGKKYTGSAADMASHTSDDPYLRLGNAIILQAVKDYRIAKKALETTDWEELTRNVPVRERNRIMNNRDDLIRTIEEIEDFFRSEYFMTLTKADGRAILKRLVNE